MKIDGCLNDATLMAKAKSIDRIYKSDRRKFQ